MDRELDVISFHKEDEDESGQDTAGAAETTTTITATYNTPEDIVEIPSRNDEDFGGCFVEVLGKGLYRPEFYKPPAPVSSVAVSEEDMKESAAEEAAPQSSGFFSNLVNQVRSGVTTGQRERTQKRCAQTMRLFRNVDRGVHPFVPADDVAAVNDYKCACVVDCDVDGRRCPYIATGWLTVTPTALLFNGSLVLSPARPTSVPEPEVTDVVFALDVDALVSAVAAQCTNSDSAEVLAGLQAPEIVEAEDVASASACILFDRSGHAHQFYDFVWCFTNYAPDALRDITVQIAKARAVREAEQPISGDVYPVTTVPEAPHEQVMTAGGDEEEKEEEEDKTFTEQDTVVMS